MTRSHKDLRAYIEVLEDAGKLRRITMPINKDTELHPLVRLQFRGLQEKDRKAFLFENVFDAKGNHFDIPVLVAALAGSAEIYALCIGCELDDIPGRWEEALDKGTPEVFNTGQVSQFTSEGFTGLLEQQGVRISMGGK